MTEAGRSELQLRVPASTSNIGPGFDCLGAALDMYLILSGQRTGAGNETRIHYTGPETPDVDPEKDLVKTGFNRALEELGKRDQISAELDILSQIPVGGGVGASGAAIIAGLAAGFCLGSGPDLPRETIYQIAYEEEGHPDNITPSLYGGITLSYLEDKTPDWMEIGIDFPSTFMVIPDLNLETDRARKILPRNVPLEDAVLNLSRTGMLVNTLMTGNWDQLPISLQDRLHESYRLELIPGGERVMKAGLEAGALGVWVSGAGPTLGCFTEDADQKPAERMKKVFEEQDVQAVIQPVSIDGSGLTLLRYPEA